MQPEINQEGNYTPYFLSIEERKSTTLIKELEKVVPEPLGAASILINQLFITTEVHLYLPWWDDENKTNKPTYYYELKFSSKFGKNMAFVSPYDPVLVRFSVNNSIVGVIYNGHLFNRTNLPIPHLLELLEDMAHDPNIFFEKAGKRWGKCLCCKKTLTNANSLERAIGPICYKRISNLNDTLTKKMRLSVSPKHSQTKIIPILTFFNPIEQEAIDEANKVLERMKGYGLMAEDVGFVVKSQDNGTLLHHTPSIQIMNEIKSMLDLKKTPLFFVIERQTSTTIATLLELKVQKVQKGRAFWVVGSEMARTLGHYFEVKGLENMPRTDTQVKDRMVIVRGERDFQVIGHTFPHKDKLRQIGGAWDPNTKTWHFDNKQFLLVQEVVDFLNGNV